MERDLGLKSDPNGLEKPGIEPVTHHGLQGQLLNHHSTKIAENALFTCSMKSPYTDGSWKAGQLKEMPVDFL